MTEFCDSHIFYPRCEPACPTPWPGAWRSSPPFQPQCVGPTVCVGLRPGGLHLEVGALSGDGKPGLSVTGAVAPGPFPGQIRFSTRR